MPASSFSADTLAIALKDALAADADFTLPALDLTGAEFTFPTDNSENPLYTDITALTEADLTDRTVGGSGMFDGLMATIMAQLREEFSEGRITGKEYSTVYIASMQGAMGAAVQYLQASKATYWQTVLIQQQAQAAEIAVYASRLQLEAAKAQAATARVEAETAAANYSLIKLKLASEDIAYGTALAQKTRVDYENANILPAQYAQLLKQTDQLDYQLVNLFPKQVLKVQSEIDVSAGQISHLTSQTNQVLYQTATLLPAQKLGIDMDTSIKTYQHDTVLPAQVAGVTADTVGKTYTNTYLLPEQLNNLQEQTEGHRAKTLDTRVDGTTPIAGAVGKQKDLQQQQIASYQRDAEAKVAKMLLDTWITQKSLDEGLVAPYALDDANINAALDTVKTNLSIPVVVPA